MQGSAFSRAQMTLLGEGPLTWLPAERRTDRYGSVVLASLHETGPWPSLIREDVARQFNGRVGELIAVVKIVRKSSHCGDLFRGLYPRPQEVGKIIVLGRGRLFVEPWMDGGVLVGLRPEDGRKTDWLDPQSLYDAHDQTVELSFVPEETR
jgi:hypothetical protein